jgi:hypothetical protein
MREQNSRMQAGTLGTRVLSGEAANDQSRDFKKGMDIYDCDS